MKVGDREKKKIRNLPAEMSESNFKYVAENSLAGIYVVQNGAFKYVNPRFAEIHGYLVDELLEKGPKDMVVPEDLHVVNKNLRDRISGETEAVHFEFRIITKKKEIRWVEVYGSRTDYNGKPAVIGTLLDISERKKSEEALRRHQNHLEELIQMRTIALEKEISKHERTEKALKESEEKYRAIFEKATEGIFQTTPEGHCLSVNPAFALMFGYDSPEEMISSVTNIGRQIYVNPSDRDNIQKLLAEKGEVKGYEAEAYRKDGKKIWISINAHMVRDDNGAEYYEGTNQDITERKRMEEKVLESEERYRIAIEYSNDGVSLSKGGLNIYVNQKYLDIFGYDRPEEVIGKSHSITVHPSDRNMVTDYNEKRNRGEPAPSRYEFKGIRKDGTSNFIEISVATTPYRGELVSLAYMRDITERREMEERLRITSIVDELTGLYNRRGFFTLCQQQLKLAERSNKSLALFFVDLDRMKWINDTLGHQEGDRALIRVATILHHTFRTDVIGRLGGMNLQSSL